MKKLLTAVLIAGLAVLGGRALGQGAAATKSHGTPIPDETKRAATSRGDLSEHRVDTCLIDIDDAYSRALARKAKCARASHARSRRRDDADFVLEPHGFLSFKPRFLCCGKARRAGRHRSRGSHGA